MKDLKLEDIQRAKKVLEKIIHSTSFEYSVSASQKMGSDIFFKFENMQRTGSFKIRGAFNKIISLSESEKAKGVVASSAGNHAQGVALSASLAKVKAKIVMPESASLNKISATRAYGAEVILKGEIYDDAYEYARELEKQEGLVFVHPYEDPFVIAGQGTIALEIFEAKKDLDSIVVPIGGGGLISGIALTMKSLNPKIKIYGVQSAQAPGMSQLFHHQKYEPIKKRISTIADGIAVKKPSPIMYENFIAKYVDEVVTVTDDEIAEAIVFLLERTKALVEGSGAVTVAAALNNKLKLGKSSCLVLSGGNIDLNIIAKVIERGQLKRGRLVELSVIVDDLPGTLHRLTKAIADTRANILEVHHDRISQGLFLRETRVDFVLETTSLDHIDKIKLALVEAGAKIL